MTLLPAAYLPSVEYFAHLLRGGCIIDLGEHFVKRSERNRTRILAPDGIMELTVQVRHANRPRQPMRDVRIDYSKRWQHQHWGALVASYKGSPYFDFYADLLAPFYGQRYEYLVDYNLGLLAVLCTALGLPMPVFSERYVEATEDDWDLRPKLRGAHGNTAIFEAEGSEAFVADPAQGVRLAGSQHALPCDSNPRLHEKWPAFGADPAQGVRLAGTQSVFRCDSNPGLHEKGPAFVAEPYVQVFSDRQPFAPNLSAADLLFAEGPAAVSVLRRCLPES